MTRWRRTIVVGLWLVLLLGFWLYAVYQEASAGELLAEAVVSASQSALAPLLLLAVYALRPLFLLPVTVLTVASGFLFGALWGAFYALGAALLSSSVGYLLGRYLGAETPAQRAPGFLRRLRERSFETVLVSRFLLLPGDLVNYAAGFLRISYGAFIVATAIGGVPGLLAGVLAGASIEGEFEARGVAVNLPMLLFSAGLFVLSLGGSYWYRRRSALARELEADERPDVTAIVGEKRE